MMCSDFACERPAKSGDFGVLGHLVRAAVDHGAKGIVIQGLGWGNVNLAMFVAIKEEIAKRGAGRHHFTRS
jgi:hypothetical protein